VALGRPPLAAWARSLLGEGIKSAFISKDVNSSHSRDRAKWGACTKQCFRDNMCLTLDRTPLSASSTQPKLNKSKASHRCFFWVLAYRVAEQTVR